MSTNNAVIEMLSDLHLSEFKKALPELLNLALAIQKQPSYLEFIKMCLDTEVVARQVKSLSARMKQARFPYEGVLENFDFGFQTSVSRRQIDTLKEMHWLKDAYNLIFLGPPGIGNYRKYLVMERNDRTSYYFNDCMLISFHNISQ